MIALVAPAADPASVAVGVESAAILATDHRLRSRRRRQQRRAGDTRLLGMVAMLAPVRLPADFLGERAGAFAEARRHPATVSWTQTGHALRDQCAEPGVPFFMLQMTGGRKQIPADLFVRQFPGG